MRNALKSHHPRRHANSFKYASKGIIHALRYEANFRVEAVFAVISISLGVVYNISVLEWILTTIVLGMLISAELVNTLVEEFIDHLIKEHNEGARIIKDLAAGYVLSVSICVFIVLCLIFLPKIYLSLLK